MPIVLISRGTMSGVEPLVGCLRRRTGIPCVSREDLVKIVNRHGALAQRIVDRLGGAAQDYEAFCDLRRPYLILMRAALLEYARNDDLIYLGFSGHLLLPRLAHVLTFRLHASLAYRTTLTRQRLHCGEEEARRYVERDDEERVRWARFMYGRDIRDPGLYDVCINIERTSIDTTCGIIQEMLRDPDCQSTPASASAVERLWLGTRIEAALLTDPRTEAIEVRADVTDGGVTVIGPYLDDARHAAVLEVARAVPGADEATYEYGFATELAAGLEPATG